MTTGIYHEIITYELREFISRVQLALLWTEPWMAHLFCMVIPIYHLNGVIRHEYLPKSMIRPTPSMQAILNNNFIQLCNKCTLMQYKATKVITLLYKILFEAPHLVPPWLSGFWSKYHTDQNNHLNNFNHINFHAGSYPANETGNTWRCAWIP